MDDDEELIGVVGLDKSNPHTTREKDEEQEGGTVNTMEGIRTAETSRG